MTRPSASNVGDAWSILDFSSYSLPYWTYLFVSILVTTRHQTGSPECSLLAAGRPRPDEIEAFGFQRFFSTLGVSVMRVAAVNDDVAFIEKGFDQIDGPVDRIACLHEQDDFAWLLKRTNKLFGRVRANNLLSRVVRNKSIKHRRVTVVNCYRITIAFAVGSQVLAHDAETDHSYRSHIFLLSSTKAHW